MARTGSDGEEEEEEEGGEEVGREELPKKKRHKHLKLCQKNWICLLDTL